jgi:hypothetical protein
MYKMSDKPSIDKIREFMDTKLFPALRKIPYHLTMGDYITENTSQNIKNKQIPQEKRLYYKYRGFGPMYDTELYGTGTLTTTKKADALKMLNDIRNDQLLDHKDMPAGVKEEFQAALDGLIHIVNGLPESGGRRKHRRVTKKRRTTKRRSHRSRRH